MQKVKVILIPGNGSPTMEDHWFPYVRKELAKLGLLGLEVIAKNFPDPELAREKYWIPFIESLNPDENTILIGHSSGTAAAMRYAENNKILGSVLVGAYYTDLGDENEIIAGYCNRPWNWQAIKNNQKWIVQFGSSDDPAIPITEQREVHKLLDTEYYEFKDRGHFLASEGQTTFPEIISIIKTKIS